MEFSEGLFGDFGNAGVVTVDPAVEGSARGLGHDARRQNLALAIVKDHGPQISRKFPDVSCVVPARRGTLSENNVKLT